MNSGSDAGGCEAPSGGVDAGFGADQKQVMANVGSGERGYYCCKIGNKSHFGVHWIEK